MASDEELYRRVREGDRAAFRRLYDRHAAPLFTFLRGYVAQREDAEDLIHEVFLQTLQSREVVFDRASFRTWLYRIGRNRALNRLRSERRARGAAQRWPATEDAAGSDQIHEDKARFRALDQAVQRLPPALAEVYALRARGLSYADMAEILEVPMGTLKSRMHEMVGRLRQELRTWQE